MRSTWALLKLVRQRMLASVVLPVLYSKQTLHIFLRCKLRSERFLAAVDWSLSNRVVDAAGKMCLCASWAGLNGKKASYTQPTPGLVNSRRPKTKIKQRSGVGANFHNKGRQRRDGTRTNNRSDFQRAENMSVVNIDRNRCPLATMSGANSVESTRARERQVH